MYLFDNYHCWLHSFVGKNSFHFCFIILSNLINRYEEVFPQVITQNMIPPLMY